MDSGLRHLIGRAIVNRFEQSYQDHGISFDPDTCWEAADDAVAAIVTALTGQDCEPLRQPKTVGVYGFKIAEPHD